MTIQILKYKKGEKVHLDEIIYPFSEFEGCFDKVDGDEMEDDTICNTNVEVIIKIGKHASKDS